MTSVKLVGAEGFEPPALCSQSRCATRLRYAPTPKIVSQQTVRLYVAQQPTAQPHDYQDRDRQDRE